VWVHENGGEFRGIAKFVKADKVDGRYISSVTEPVTWSTTSVRTFEVRRKPPAGGQSVDKPDCPHVRLQVPRRSSCRLGAAFSLVGSGRDGSPACDRVPADYYGGIAPEVFNTKLLAKVRELCSLEFGVFHSGITATPLWTAQHLTADAVRQAKAVARDDVFHPDTRLPASERSELSQYRGSGLGSRPSRSRRRHGDERSAGRELRAFQHGSPTAGPQRKPWADIEETSRQLALKYGEVFIVSGPTFTGVKLARIGQRVYVPTNLYKAVYVPSVGRPRHGGRTTPT
jgi:endonuclease G